MKFAKRFFRRIFGNTLTKHQLDVEVRCLHQSHDKDSLWPKQFWCRSRKELEDHWVEIDDLNRLGYDIHFTVVPRLRMFQGKKEHPLPDKPVVSCIWSDLDVGKDKPYRTVEAAWERIHALKPAPNIIVESGTGLHAYYLLAKPTKMSRERLERILRALASRLRGDAGAARATRLMRLPNTYNWKTKRGKLARVRYLSKKGYRLKRLEALWKTSDAGDERTTKHDAGNGGRYSEFFASHVKQFALRGSEATGLCPFHEDHGPSFSVNVNTGLWKCRSSRCGAKGNLTHFCARLEIPLPNTAEVRRFPRLALVNGAELVRRVETFIRRFVVLPAGALLPLAIWVIGTHLFDVFEGFAYVVLVSPEKRCGKTRLTEVLQLLAHNPRSTVSITEAALFRMVDAEKPTLILDEAEALAGRSEKGEAVRALLNAGNRRGVSVPRVVGKSRRLEYFSIYCPKVVCAIRYVPDTVLDRAIKIAMQRKRPSERVDRFILRLVRPEGEELEAMIESWAMANREEVEKRYKAEGAPDFLADREAENFEALFAVLAVADPALKDELSEAAKVLTKQKAADAQEESLSLRLLADIKTVFEDVDHAVIWTEHLLECMACIEDAPWQDGDKPLTARRLARMLRPFGVEPCQVRLGKKNLRGYRREDFEAAFARYLAPASATTATPRINTGDSPHLPPATAAPCSTLENPSTPPKIQAGSTCSGLPGRIMRFPRLAVSKDGRIRFPRPE